jgi:hypothetical protein
MDNWCPVNQGFMGTAGQILHHLGAPPYVRQARLWSYLDLDAMEEKPSPSSGPLLVLVLLDYNSWWRPCNHQSGAEIQAGCLLRLVRSQVRELTIRNKH